LGQAELIIGGSSAINEHRRPKPTQEFEIRVRQHLPRADKAYYNPANGRPPATLTPRTVNEINQQRKHAA
jgi:hypothetical protein